MAGIDARFRFDEYSLVCQDAFVDGSIQMVVQKALRVTIRYNTHYPIAAGCLDAIKINKSLRSQFYWTRIGSGVYSYLKKSKLWRRLGIFWTQQR